MAHTVTVRLPDDIDSRLKLEVVDGIRWNTWRSEIGRK